MEIETILKEKIGQQNVFLNEDMSEHTTFKTGGKADFFVIANNIEELKFILQISKDYNLPLFIIGNGSNILVTDKGVRGIICKINIKKFEVREEGKDIFVTLGSGEKNAIISQKLLNLEISGFEFAAGIPGTIGGAIKMNAGAHEKEMKDIVFETEYLDVNGKIKKIRLNEHNFSYRHSIFSNNKYIIIESTLKLNKGQKFEIENKMKEYLSFRKEKQPINMPSAGSTFKRGNGFFASKLIDECGLKGFKIGGAKVSEKHAGFIVNTGNATSKDILELIEHVRKVVYDKTGDKLELEVEVIGEE